MISFENVSFNYSRTEEASVKNISLSIKAGECVLLCGESGCGKTTLIRMLNGLIPHFYEGQISGQVTVGDMNITTSELYETARMVGSVFQNPRSQFFCVDSTSELAFGPENMGLPEEEIIKRIDETVECLGVQKLMNRNIFEMSGGEKQKIACASVDTLRPSIYALDEPTSNLSLEAIEELKSTLKTWKKAGRTIVVAEHRLYWLKEICDRVICLKNGEVEFDISMDEFKNFSEQELRKYGLRSINEDLEMRPIEVNPPLSKDRYHLKNFKYNYKGFDALNIDELKIPKNEIIGIIGPNGAGKSTFSKCLCGLMRGFKGYMLYDGEKIKPKALLKKSYMVMQDVNHQLFCESVEDEIRLGMDEANEGEVDVVIEQLGLSDLLGRHPMSLSGGQKQRVAIASAILAGKEILLFDEPTSGLDFFNMEKVAELIKSLRGKHTVFVVTHDPDLVRRCCTKILRFEDGHVVIEEREGISHGREKEKCSTSVI